MVGPLQGAALNVPACDWSALVSVSSWLKSAGGRKTRRCMCSTAQQLNSSCLCLARDVVPMCEGGLRFSVKEYRFAEEEEEQEGDEPRPELVVLIPEVLDSQYGMYVWPCAVVLAQYLWFHKRMLSGKRILEIGAGVSLPGIVAAKCGAEVILSDTEELPQCLENCQRSCRLNNLPGVHITGLTWGQISPNLLSLPQVDIILASDVFFEPEDFEDVITTVHFLMKRNPHAQFWTTYQVRSSDWSIEALLYKWKMKNIHVPLSSFNADKEQLASSPLPGRHTIEMMIISLAGASYT